MPSEAYYTLLINGDRFFCYKYTTNANQYIQIEDLPEYEAMLTGECVAVVDNGSPERLSYDALEDELKTCSPRMTKAISRI